METGKRSNLPAANGSVAAHAELDVIFAKGEIMDMELKATLRLSESDQAELAQIMDCDEDKIVETLEPYASAAIEELITMFQGKKVFSRGSDIREYRLYLLVKHAFSSRIPSEQRVCRLFQCTSSESRSLIRAVMSKYQYLLKDAIFDTLKDLMDTSELAEDGESLTIAISNQNLVDELNRKLAEIDPSYPPVKKKPNSVSTYEVKPSSYGELCKYFHIQSKLGSDE